MELIDIENFICKCPETIKKNGRTIKLKKKLDSQLIKGVWVAKHGWGSLVQTYCVRCRVIHFTDVISDKETVN